MSANISKEKILEYLKTIIQLEAMKQTHIRAKNIVRDKTAKCNDIIATKDYAHTVAEKANKPKDLLDNLVIFMPGGVLGFCGGGICLLIYYIFKYDPISWLGAGWFWKAVFGCTVAGAVIGLIIGVIIIIREIKKYHATNKANKLAAEQYNKKVDSNNKLLVTKRADAKNLKTVCLQESDILSVEERKINKLLSDLYACDIIYPKYRKIEYICNAYDYLSSGLCNSLEGPNGVYARLEDDIKFGRIMDKLDVIINKLDDIINNQRESAWMLSQLVGGVNKLGGTLDSISNKLDTMSSSNTAIASALNSIEYNTAVSSQCAQFSAICDYYRLKKYN